MPRRAPHATRDRPRHPAGAWLCAALAVGVIGVGLAWTWPRPWGAHGAEGQASGAEAAYRIRVNAAEAVELQLLPGIGPRLAEAIIVERRDGGAFTDSQDLQRVRGIGVKLHQRIGPYVRFD